MDEWIKKNPIEKFAYSGRQRQAIHRLLIDMNESAPPLDNILEILDSIKFGEIVVRSGEISNQLKFDDCMPPQIAKLYLDDGTGSICPSKFKTWIFGNLETVCEMRGQYLEQLEEDLK